MPTEKKIKDGGKLEAIINKQGEKQEKGDN
jgi:hypothetical protein